MKTLKYSLVALFAVILAAAVTLTGPRSAQAAIGYQFPCSPYGNAYYGFGQYVSGWGYHAGEDTCKAAGLPVYAVADGTVVYSAKTPDSYRWGNLILIEHVNPDGSRAVSLYGHLSADRKVAAGQQVSKGQHIGYVGPGWTAENGNWGAHIHFAIRHGGYGAAVGTYAPGINGYVDANRLGEYANPTAYINQRVAVYDYQVAGITGSGTYGKNAQFYVEVHLRNTGNTTWTINGATPMRLGTIAPPDHGAAFSNGVLGHGWQASNRISLVNETPPGGIGVFTARFNAGAVPSGRYIERFAPVVEGIGWLPNRNINWDITVLPPRDHAAWYNHVVSKDTWPTSINGNGDAWHLLPGQTVNIKAMIRNAGDTTWNAGGSRPIRLGTWRPADRGSPFATGGNTRIETSENWISPARPSGLDGRYDETTKNVVPASSIEPGQVAVFSFTLTAPNAPGVYAESFQPVIEGVRWLNDLGAYFPVRVLPPGYHYEFAGVDYPAPLALETGKSVVGLNLRNTGQAAWPVNGNVRLGTDRARDRASAFANGTWLAPNRPTAIDTNVTRPGAATVEPSEVARFEFEVATQSLVDGTYAEYLQPLVEGVTWMPEQYGMYAPVKVASPALAQRVTNVTYDKDPASLHYGDLVNAKLAIRNLGAREWPVSGENAVRLGTDNPQDRPSTFASDAIPDPWLADNRPSAIDGRVTDTAKMTSVPDAQIGQGETAYIQVPFYVGSQINPGSYPEHVNLVMEGVSWLPDVGAYFPISVATAPALDSQYVSASYSRPTNNLHPGDELTVTLAVKNTGRNGWATDGDNAVKLGTAHPYDRSSAFAVLTGLDPWLSANRASKIEGKLTDLATLASTPVSAIMPGETAVFKLPLKVPDLQPGTHNEYFNLVIDGQQWLPDDGMFVPITIVP